MAKGQGRGNFIPGFDCAAGLAVNHTHGEWAELTKDKVVVQRNGYAQVFDVNDTLLYEIYDERQ